MSRTPPHSEKLDILAEQVTRALAADASVIKIAETLLSKIADSAALDAQLATDVAQLKESVNLIKKTLYENNGDSLTTKVSKLVDAAKNWQDGHIVDRTGKWNLKAAFVQGLFTLLGAIAGGFIVWLLTPKPAAILPWLLSLLW
jgi:hypothetical protein